MNRSRRGSVFSLGAVVLSALLTASAQAGLITVQSSADGGGTCPGATCTLRQAIATAAAGDTINFAAGLTTIDLTSDELKIAKNLTIRGPGANILSVRRSTAAGTPKFRIFNVVGNTVTISDLTITNGLIDDPTGFDSIGLGGGLRHDGGTLNLTGCVISANGAGAMQGADGGGIYNSKTAGTLTVSNSAIVANHSNNNGGGIRNEGTLTIINSTMFGNTAPNGGAINAKSGTVTITNSTISGNGANAGGGILTAAGTVATLRNTIVAANTAPSFAPDADDIDSQGYNLIGNNKNTNIVATTGDQIGTPGAPINPLLGPLQDNGGPTKTLALLSGSPAIEAGDSGGSGTDQRGYARPVDSSIIPNVGDGSDIGAYEVQADVLPGCSSISKVVTNANDSGANSLRGVIASVCAGSTITFAPNLGLIPLTSGEILINKSLIFDGPGPQSLGVRLAPGAPNSRIFNIAPNVNVTLSGMIVVFGNADSGAGGGISNSGNLTLTNMTVSANSALLGGGGIHNNGGTLTLINSAVLGNSVNSGSGGILNSGTLTITNSTINGNTAKNGNGGGIVNTGTTTVTSSTISSNIATGGAGGGIHSPSGAVTVRNSIIALNTATTAPDFNGTFTSQGFNLIGNSSGATISPAQFTDLIGTAGSPIDPLLGQPDYNGGFVETQALLPNSPAIDQGDSGGLTTDARSFKRPVNLTNVSNAPGGDGSDIGAFEVQASPTPTPTATATATAAATATATATATAAPTATPVHTPTATPAHTPTATPTSTPTATPSSTPTATPGVVTTLANISTRLRVETGDNVLIAGFIITGTQSKKVIIRGIGPSLPLAGHLDNPTLELRDSSGMLLDSNDDWGNSPNKQAIIDSTIPPSNNLESAIVATLPANGASYTAIVRGVNGGTGIGVVEVYDLGTAANSKLANISTRGFVSIGDNVMIAGTIIVGSASQKVIIRATGPSVPVAGHMADPTLELRDGNGSLLEANDNWVDSLNKQAIIDSTIAPSNNLESAIVRALVPANYTAIVRGTNNATGIAVVEVYALNF